MRHRFTKVLLGLVVFTMLAGTATVAAQSHQSAKSTASYNVGVVYSRTGVFAAYGAEYVQGLRLGLKYATNGTNKVNGKDINLTFADDKTDPATAVSAAKDLIGQGYKIIMGSESSGAALQVAPLAAQNKVLFLSGPAANDGITGINKYTFRSGRQTLQDVNTVNAFLKGAGKKVVCFVQDSAFGHGNTAAVRALVGGKGHTVTEVAVPGSATDFTPFAQQVKNANPDLVFVAWAGSTAAAMWKALDQQNVFTANTDIVTGLAERATWSSLGDQATKIHVLSHYVYTAPKNKVNDWLVKEMRKKSQVPDIFTPDGFNAALMLVQALKKGNYDVDAMITALEGFKFLGPKGFEAIRPQDHATLQPMFRVQLVKNGSRLVPKLLGTANSYQTAPPIVAMRG